VIIPKDRDLLKFCSYLDSQSEYQLSDAIQNKIASKYGNVRVASTNNNLGEYSTLVFQLADHFIKYSQTHGLIKTSEIDIPDSVRETMERIDKLEFGDEIPKPAPRDTDTPAPKPTPPDTPVPKDKKLTPSIIKKFFSNLNLPGWLLKILNSRIMKILGIVGTIAGAGFLIYDIATQGFAEAVDTPQEKAIFAAVITDLAAWASLVIPPPVGPVAFGILNALSLGAGVLSWVLPDDEDDAPKPAQKPTEQKPSEENQDKPGAKPLGDSTNNLLYEAIVDVTGTSQIRVKNLIKFKAEIEDKIDRLSKMYPGSSAESAKQKLNASIAKWSTAK
jgi:hypothetical protein